MPRLKKYSSLTDEVLDINADYTTDLVELASLIATGHDDVIVFFEGPLPALQRWHEETGSFDPIVALVASIYFIAATATLWFLLNIVVNVLTGDSSACPQNLC